MSVANSIADARTRYAKLIAERRSEIAALETKIRLLDEIESDMATPEIPEIAAQLPPRHTAPTEVRFSGMGLSDAALAALKQLETNGAREISKTQVAKVMTDNGYIPKGKNFLISVDVALRRFAETGKLKSELVAGRRYYRSPKPHELV